MEDQIREPLEGQGKIIQIDEEQVKRRLDNLVRGTVEETINELLEAEADELLGANRYERTESRKGHRSGSYSRRLHTTAGEIKVRVPKLRSLPFESAIIERYRTRQISVEEAIVEMYLAGVSVRRVEDITEALWQRCMVHFYRNVFTKVPPKMIREVADMLKAIHAQESKDEARKKAASIVERLRAMKLSDAAKIVETGIEETLSYYEFPPQHRVRIRTNNRLERLMKEIRRRTRVVGSFPDGQSALMLVAARLRYVASKTWGSRIYLNMSLLNELDTNRGTA